VYARERIARAPSKGSEEAKDGLVEGARPFGQSALLLPVAVLRGALNGEAHHMRRQETDFDARREHRPEAGMPAFLDDALGQVLLGIATVSSEVYAAIEDALSGDERLKEASALARECRAQDCARA
jgi:hypothetical protein